MKVKLSTRKGNKGPTAPFVIEIYRGHVKNADGKIRHNRSFRTLDYYLYKVPKSPQQKQHNKEHQRLAEAVRSKMELDLVNGEFGFKSTFKSQVNFIDYFTKLRDERKETKNNHDNWHGALKYLKQYCPSHATFKDVDVAFVDGFKNYLDKKAKLLSGKPLAQNTKHSYFNKFRACINQAYEEGLIQENPLRSVKSFQMGEPQREYLTIEEVKLLSKTECRYEVLKRAFLFSCLSGLRWSDIQKLTWKEVRKKDDHWEVAFRQQKTKGVEYLPINQEALVLLNAPGQPEDRVFTGLNYSSYMNVALQQWVMKAGITKSITFHCARHTFATLQLTLGTDIYTVSKLLGHRDLKTTQVYAKIIDEKKQDAVNRIPSIL